MIQDQTLVKLPGNEERWAGHSTLAETIFTMVQEKKTGTEEFKQLIAYYGREKLVQLYKQVIAEKGILPLNAVNSSIDNRTGEKLFEK